MRIAFIDKQFNQGKDSATKSMYGNARKWGEALRLTPPPPVHRCAGRHALGGATRARSRSTAVRGFRLNNVRKRTERAGCQVHYAITPATNTRRPTNKGATMNRSAWIGMIVWGLLLTAFGIATAAAADSAGAEMPAQDVVFLLSGGLLTCLIGVAGLTGIAGWIPGMARET